MHAYCIHVYVWWLYIILNDDKFNSETEEGVSKCWNETAASLNWIVRESLKEKMRFALRKEEQSSYMNIVIVWTCNVPQSLCVEGLVPNVAVFRNDWLMTLTSSMD
jgi:hypothetical protein